MESLAFKEWAKTEDLILNDKIESFGHTVIGVDAEHYLNTILTDAQTREPLLPALGGLPFALQQHVDKDLANLKQVNLKPIFVFNGIELACKDRKSINRESQKAATLLDEAWRVYDLGRGDDAVVAFGKACTYRTTSILRHLMYYVHEQGYQVFVAPYSAAAQLVYFEQEEYTNSTYGSANLMVFGLERIVTGFNWETMRVQFVVRDSVLAKLGMGMSSFVDLCLLSGSSILATMPEVDADTTSTPKFTVTRRLLASAHNDGHIACLRANDEEYLGLYRKAKAAIKHMVIMWSDGQYKQLDFDNAPHDTHEFVGTRLPDELMAYHRYGFVGERVLNWRTHEEIIETSPLDGGSSQAYRDLIQEKLRPLRNRSLAILTRNLHRYFTKQEVTQICWFSESDKRAIGVKDLDFSDAAKDAETWHVKESLMNQSAEAKKIDLDKSPLQFAIALLSDESLAKKTVTRRREGQHSVLNKRAEMSANIVWRFLQDRGYINSDHTLSAWGKALKASLDRARSDGLLSDEKTPSNEIEEALFMAFELLRLDLLSNKTLFNSPQYSGAPMRGTDADKANVLLVSRIACLGTFQHGAIGYTGPLSRHLLAYHQITAAVRNSLRDLTEMHGCNMMLSGSAVRIRDQSDYTEIGARLPFTKEPDLGLALVVKSHLDELSQDQSRRADITRWFNHALNIQEDLQKAWHMWDAVNAGIQAADSAIVSSETKALFENTDTWLEKKRSGAS